MRRVFKCSEMEGVLVELETIQNLLENKELTKLKEMLKDMNEFDIAVLIEDLTENQLVQAFRLLPKSMAADVFVNLDEEIQVKLISVLTNAEATRYY